MLLASDLVFSAQFAHPTRGITKFGMRVVLPDWFLAFQESKKFPAADFVASGFDQETASPARADQRVDFLEQIVGQQDVCTVCGHNMYTCSVL